MNRILYLVENRNGVASKGTPKYLRFRIVSVCSNLDTIRKPVIGRLDPTSSLDEVRTRNEEKNRQNAILAHVQISTWLLNHLDRVSWSLAPYSDPPHHPQLQVVVPLDQHNIPAWGSRYIHAAVSAWAPYTHCYQHMEHPSVGLDSALVFP